jgi:hypothetical protein
MDFKMEKNVGRTDRIVRIIIGVVLLIAFAENFAKGWLNFIVLLIALIALFTGLAGWCCCYALLGWSTLEKGGAQGIAQRPWGKK